MDKKPARKNDSGENDAEDAERTSESTQEAEATDSQSTGSDTLIGTGRSGSVQASTVSGAPSGRDGRSRSAGGGYVDYDRGPDPAALSARYGLEVGGKEAGRLEQLEGEFGSERVQRWADEGMPVEAMGKPRDMRAFRKSGEEGPADEQVGSDTGTQTGAGVRLQAKLEVSSPGDPAEREAEQVAERVMEMDASEAHPSEVESDAGECNQGEQDGQPARTGAVKRSGGLDVSGEAETRVRKGVQGGGKPLPADTRAKFEGTLGADLSNVRVHTGSQADEAARSINAEAYTMGSDIAFADSNYNPGSKTGQALLAHELTHTVQQGGGPSRATATVHRQKAGLKEYTVQPGDSLSKIAAQFGVPGGWPALYDENRAVVGKNPHLIHPGDELVIPGTQTGGSESGKDGKKGGGTGGGKTGSGETSSGETSGRETKETGPEQPGEAPDVSGDVEQKEQLTEQILSWVPDMRGVTSELIDYADSIGLSLATLNATRKFMTKLLASVNDIATLSRALDTVKYLRNIGWSVDGIADFWHGLLFSPKWSSPHKAANQLVDAINPSNKFFQFLGKVGDIASAVGAFFTGWEIGTALRQQKFGKAAGKAYKFIMGLAVPVAGIVDAVVSVIHTVFGKVPYVGAIADFIKSINPIALGGVAVDTLVSLIDAAVRAIAGGNWFKVLLELEQRMQKNIGGLINLFEALGIYDVLGAGIDTVVTLADMVLKWEFSMAEIEELVRRYKQYGLGTLVDLGENLGDAVYDAVQGAGEVFQSIGETAGSVAETVTKPRNRPQAILRYRLGTKPHRIIIFNRSSGYCLLAG